MTRTEVAVGVDIGGGKILAGRVDESGRVKSRIRTATPLGSSDALVAGLVQLIKELGPGLPVGVGAPGLVTPDGELRIGPNLAIERLPLRRILEDRLSVPVRVDNDAVAALWAEYRLGAGVGSASALLLTLGTGVGGAAIEGGRFILGTGFGGEFGHIAVSATGRACSCGSLGCLEAYTSGTAIGARARELLAGANGPSSVLDLQRGFTEIDVTRAAADGDPFARDVVLEAGTWLGVGLASLVNAYDPAVVILGGGVTESVGNLLVPEATAIMQRRLVGAAVREPPSVIPAELGDDAGMVGAALLALGGIEERR